MGNALMQIAAVEELLEYLHFDGASFQKSRTHLLSDVSGAFHLGPALPDQDSSVWGEAPLILFEQATQNADAQVFHELSDKIDYV